MCILWIQVAAKPCPKTKLCDKVKTKFKVASKTFGPTAISFKVMLFSPVSI